MPFQPGQSGNPSGRPKGIFDKRNQYRALIESHAPALINKAVEKALDGDMKAMQLCIERILPRAKHATAPLPLTSDNSITPEKLLSYGDSLLEAIISGNLDASDARTISQLLDSQRRLIETTELENRIQSIENTLTKI